MKSKDPIKKRRLGKSITFLLPSVKMKSSSQRGVPFEREFHDFLMNHFKGYTVTAGSITGYWLDNEKAEECNEHRQYQVALSRPKDLPLLERRLALLAGELGERTVFCDIHGDAYIVEASPSA